MDFLQVKRAGLLDALGDQEKKLQEAMFEVITSEASYLRSLNILITHFMAAPELSGKYCLVVMFRIGKGYKVY